MLTACCTPEKICVCMEQNLELGYSSCWPLAYVALQSIMSCFRDLFVLSSSESLAAIFLQLSAAPQPPICDSSCDEPAMKTVLTSTLRRDVLVSASAMTHGPWGVCVWQHLGLGTLFYWTKNARFSCMLVTMGNTVHCTSTASCTQQSRAPE